MKNNVLAELFKVNTLIRIENAEKGSGDGWTDSLNTEDALIVLLKLIAGEIRESHSDLAKGIEDALNWEVNMLTIPEYQPILIQVQHILFRHLALVTRQPWNLEKGQET